MSLQAKGRTDLGSILVHNQALSQPNISLQSGLISGLNRPSIGPDISLIMVFDSGLRLADWWSGFKTDSGLLVALNEPEEDIISGLLVA